MLHLSMLMRRDALNAFYAKLISYLFFKQQSHNWHNLSSLGRIAFIQIGVKIGLSMNYFSLI